MLSTRIRPTTSNPNPTAAAPSTEDGAIDIFSSALSALFTDDTQSSHGEAGGGIVYASPLYGDILLSVPARPDEEEGQRLFAHYLWNAGVVVAEGVERVAAMREKGEGGHLWWSWGRRAYWDVRGKSVLEVGAGTALPSLICAKAGAARVTITDHPSSPALRTGAIRRNVEENLDLNLKRLDGKAQVEIEIRGYVWGEEVVYDAEVYGKVVGRLERSYERVIVADCLWMPSQHAALARTIGRALVRDGEGAAIVVAGFHTGRSVVGEFFDVATTTGSGDGIDEREARLEIAEIFEVDVDGVRREWERERIGENREEGKRWCVVAILVLA